MVLPRTPRRAKEPAKYLAHIGQKGRRTGITLRPTARDENGLESIDGVFSSPEKPPVKKTGGNHASSSDGESMDIDQSTIQGPTEYLVTSRNSTKLPPRARSPIRTIIGLSPRRSLRLLNGSMPIQSLSPLPKLSFSKNSKRIITPSTDGLIRKSRKPLPKIIEKNAERNKGKKRAFDLSPTHETDDDERVESGVNGDIDITPLGLDLKGDNGVNGDTGAHKDGEDDRDVDENIDKDDKENADEQVDSPAAAVGEDQEAEGPPAKRRKAGKRLLSQQENSKKMKPPPKPKPKPAANSVAKRTVPKVKPTKRGEVIRRAKSFFAIRSKIPADDSGAIRLKSGRTSIKPLAYWKGEKVLLDEGRVEGKVHILPSMKEVVRIDEIELSEPKRPAKKVVRSKTRKSDKAEEGEEEEDEGEVEQEGWETETGIMHAQVMAWDPVIGKYDEEALEEAEIAYAAEAIEMRYINGAGFRFAKALTLPFFSSGIVDLPPGGSKRVKNSRKMQMIFSVFNGRVTVDVGTPTSRFSIGKGGMWQVPRGNFYSINNYSKTKSARIFFAQGCEVNVEVENKPA